MRGNRSRISLRSSGLLGRSVFEIILIVEGGARSRALRRGGALEELGRVARLARFARRPLGRIAADLGLQLDDVEEHIGLPA